ncbi:MAG: hypothetical protein AAGC43_17000 [Bacteroidota bacterium]
MTTLRKLGLLSIPLNFLLAGLGMIWLLQVDNASGSFFEKLISHESDWLGAHVLLLFSTIFLIPAATGIRLMVKHRIVGAIATVLVLVIGSTSVLLAGQYAIDFVMPLLAQTGGDALKVHPLLFKTPLVDILFYKLPNLVFLALFLLTITLFWNKTIPMKIKIVLITNWVLVLIGNLIHPLFQRSTIILLAFSFAPLVYFFWKNNAAEKS